MRKWRSVIALVLAMCLQVPAVAGAAPVKRRGPDGRVPAKWDLAKPRKEAHADVVPLSAGGDGDGFNNISFAYFESGDIIVVLGTLTGHAGEFDSSFYRGYLSDGCFWSANTTPVNGVQREAAGKYRSYDVAYGLWVPSLSAYQRSRARDYCRLQQGEPYSLTGSKSDQSSWYCSKLAWSSYRYMTGLDLDGDGGFWVWPVDLVNDPATYVFAYGD